MATDWVLIFVIIVFVLIAIYFGVSLFLASKNISGTVDSSLAYGVVVTALIVGILTLIAFIAILYRLFVPFVVVPVGVTRAVVLSQPIQTPPPILQCDVSGAQQLTVIE